MTDVAALFVSVLQLSRVLYTGDVHNIGAWVPSMHFSMNTFLCLLVYFAFAVFVATLSYLSNSSQ